MYFVASVRPSALSWLKVFVCVSNSCADAVNRLLISRGLKGDDPETPSCSHYNLVFKIASWVCSSLSVLMLKRHSFCGYQSQVFSAGFCQEC